jgi:uroporphyrin-III C-methyltransferase
MGVTSLPHLAAGLARHGLSATMPVAIIERGFSSSQRTTTGTIENIVGVCGELGVRSPAVLVIGEVVRLSGHGHAAAVELMQDAAELTEQR